MLCISDIRNVLGFYTKGDWIRQATTADLKWTKMSTHSSKEDWVTFKVIRGMRPGKNDDLLLFRDHMSMFVLKRFSYTLNFYSVY